MTQPSSLHKQKPFVQRVKSRPSYSGVSSLNTSPYRKPSSGPIPKLDLSKIKK